MKVFSKIKDDPTFKQISIKSFKRIIYSFFIVLRF